MAEQLRYKVTADTKQFVQGMSQVQKASGRVNKSTRKQGQAFTQLAYALDDAQYGFRGVQNNIQAIAVSAGLGGPLVLAITAATVALGYFIDKWVKGNKEAKNTIDSMIKEIKRLRGELGIDTKEDPVTKLIASHRKAIKAAKKELADLQATERVTVAPVGGAPGYSFDQTVGTEEEIKKASDKVRFLEKQLQQDVTRIHQQESAKRNKQTIQGWEATYKELQKLTERRTKTVGVNEIAPAGTSLEELEKWQKEALRLMKSFAHAWGAEWSNVGQITVMGGDKVANAIRETRDRLGHNLQEVGSTMVEAGQALQSAVTSAFVGVGVALGEALANGFDGDAALKLLGQFMVSFGSALIALGVAALAWTLALANPWLAIGAGVALVAAGTAISSSAKKQPYGKGGGGSNASQLSRSTTNNLTLESGRTTGSRGLRSSTTRGEDIRYNQQVSLDNYQAYG